MNAWIFFCCDIQILLCVVHESGEGGDLDPPYGAWLPTLPIGNCWEVISLQDTPVLRRTLKDMGCCGVSPNFLEGVLFFSPCLLCKRKKPRLVRHLISFCYHVSSVLKDELWGGAPLGQKFESPWERWLMSSLYCAGDALGSFWSRFIVPSNFH
jgi:hypothetical protein